MSTAPAALSKLVRSLLACIQSQELLRPGDRVGVAVSGGADSVALLLLLLELRKKLGIVLSVVHFNHKLRGTASDADEAFVAKLAAKLANLEEEKSPKGGKRFALFNKG